MPAHAKATAESAGPTRILSKLVALDPHRKLALDRFDRRVHDVDDQLIHGADAVAVGPRAGAAAQDLVL